MSAVDRLSEPFVQGLQQGVLRYQRCTACGQAQTLARAACVRCHAPALAWLDSAGQGCVHACTVVTRAPSDAFRERVPYTLVLVDLDEGFRLMGQGAPGLAVGNRVQARVVRWGEQPLVVFEPLAGQTAQGAGAEASMP